MPTPLIIDLSHHNTVKSFADVKAAGIVGVIHKATEGTTMSDDMYVSRKKSATQAGLTWSSYHFMKHGNMSAQMDWYLKNVDPVQGERVCLDFEDNACVLGDLEDAVNYLLNKRPDLQITVYSGHLIKEQLDDHTNPLLEHNTSLWIAQYGSSVSWPNKVWPYYTLWQYTDKGTLNGISGAVDLNQFNGSRENCIKWMTPVGSQPAPEPEPPAHEYNVGDTVRTRGGAHFIGKVVSVYNSLSGVPHVDVEAVDLDFKGTIHVYPAARVKLAED